MKPDDEMQELSHMAAALGWSLLGVLFIALGAAYL